MEQLLLTFETVVPLIDFITPTTSTSSSSSSPSSSACASQAALASVPASIPPPLAAQSDTGAGELRLMFQGAVSRFKKQALGDYSQPPLLPILVNDDPESYKKLLSEVFVAFNGDLKCPALTSTDCYSQDEIVNRVIQELLHASVQTPNILTLGYRKSSGNSRNNVVGTHAVENNYPNTIVNYVKTEPWERLLTRIGLNAMKFLLSRCCLFAMLPNNCFFQVAGIPFSEALNGGMLEIPPNWLRESLGEKKRKQEELILSIPRKKKKVDSNKSAVQHTSQVVKTLKNMDISRNAIFYGRPMHGVSGNIIFGLPKKHTLNSMKKEQNLLDLMEDIFPRNYAQKKDKALIKDKVILKRTKRNIKMHWRLVKVKELLRKIVVRHNRCNYRETFARCCARKFQPGESQTVTNKTSYLNYSLTYAEVTNYVTAILKKVIPLEFWGCEENQGKLLRVIGDLIRLRRFETYSLQSVIRCIKLSKIEWLSSSHYASHKGPSDNAKKEEIFLEFLHWVFHGVVIPLLRTNFYVTESGAHKNHIFYFRHDDWVVLTAPTVTKLGTSVFSPLTKVEASILISKRMLGFSFLRLLPKDKGARPITNLRRRITKETGPTVAPKLQKSKSSGIDFTMSINSMLQNSFQVLTYEYRKDGFLRGSSVLGMSDIYTKLKSYKIRAGKSPKGFFFIKVDVVQCFDKINQDILLKVLKDVLLEDEYLVHKFCVSYPNTGRVRRTFLKKARSTVDYPQFAAFARQAAVYFRNSVLMDQVVYAFEDKEAILEILQDHVVNNLVKIGKRFYKQTTGIPQGSILSTLLCNIFYAYLEHTEMKEFIIMDDLLLRHTDDFLYITKSEERARKFLSTMKKGFPEYGCVINIDKTLSNLPRDSQSSGQVCIGYDFPWCGLLINTKYLSVKSDYMRLAGTYLNDTLTVKYSKHPWGDFKRKIMQYFKPKCHLILVDSDLNTERVVIKNVYENYIICAMKFYLHLRDLTSHFQMPSDAFLTGTIEDAITYGYLLICSKIRSKAGQSMQAKFSLSYLTVEWLGLIAFSRVFERKKGSLASTTAFLKAKLINSKFKHIERHMRRHSSSFITNLWKVKL